jgi:hypothetical protein
MYLVDYDNTMIDVPVKIVNYQSNELDNSQADMTKWMLAKRFFVVDTIGGVSGDKSLVIRYASQIKLRIQLGGSEKI